MRICKYLAALLALCLLTASAAAEGLNAQTDEVVSPPAEAAVDEAGDFDLSGLYADEAPVPEDRAVEPSDYDSDESLDIVIPGENVSFSFYGSENVTPFSGCSDKLTIVCRKGSAVDEYAEEHGIARKYVEPTGITLSETGEVTTKVVHTLKLSASLTPSYATTELTWTSSNPDVVRVLSSDTLHARMIRAEAPGTAIITVQTSNGLSASVTYRVEGDATAAPTAAPTGEPTAAPTGEPTVAPASLSKADITVKDVTYTGTVKKSFKINPKKVTGLKLQAGKKQLTVSWKKAAGVSGYQIQYGLKASFRGAKAITAKKTAAKATIKNLKAKKQYCVRIRCYKVVKGKKCWSAWSTAVKKKTR